MRYLITSLLAVTVSLSMAPGARAACGDNPGDAQAVADTRALIQATCDCDSNSRHGAYVNCASRVSRAAVRDGSLPRECREVVMDCESNSTCGRSNYVTCCTTDASGINACEVVRKAKDCVAEPGGTACVGAAASCCDACPGGVCGATTTSTAPTTTVTATTASTTTAPTTTETTTTASTTTAPTTTETTTTASTTSAPTTTETTTTASTTTAPTTTETTTTASTTTAPTTTVTTTTASTTTAPTTTVTTTTAPTTTVTTTTATTTTAPTTTVTTTTAPTTTVTTTTATTTTAPTTTVTTTVTTSTSTSTSTTTTSTTSSTTTTTFVCNCCGQLPSLLSFTTGSTGCGTNPPGQLLPARCVQGTNNGTVCTSDAQCTGTGTQSCRGHLDCTGLYFGSGQPSGINLPGTVPDLGLSYSKIASCSGDTVNLTPTTSGDVPGPGCTTPAGTPTYGERHCTSPGCLFGAPLSLPNTLATATGTCVHNVIANRPLVGTGTGTCSTGATNSLTLPLDSKIYLTGAIEPVRTCSACVGGTPGVCGSGTCMGTSGARDGLACTPETSALSASYPTSHDCPAPNAPAGGGTCGVNSGTFIGCLPIAFNLSSGTQTKTSFATAAQARVFCGFCFDADVSTAFENPPHPCSADADCTNGFFTSCRQHNNGAFRNSFATTITETGAPAGACLADGTPHASTLVSVFCIPPSYDPIVDPSGELPGPGAVSLPGVAQFIP